MVSKVKILKKVLTMAFVFSQYVLSFLSIFNQSSKYATIVNLFKRRFDKGDFRTFFNFRGP